MSFHLPSSVILALIEADIAGRGRICPPPFPGRVILRPFPVRVLSEPTLRSFSCHENKTSASHARPCYVSTAIVRAMERIIPSATCWFRVPTGRRMLRVAGRGPPRDTLDRPPRGKVTQPPPTPRDDINLRDGQCTVDNNDNVNMIMPSSGDTLNVHSLQTMP